MLENLRECILWLLATVSLILAIYMYKKQNSVERVKIIKEESYSCKYNDNTQCYEMCCNYCLGKNECNWCCGGDSNNCDGFSKNN